MITTIISAFIMIIIVFYIWNTWAEDKFKWITFKTIIIIILSSIATLLNYYSVSVFFKIYSMTFIFCIAYKILFGERLNKIIVISIVTQSLYLIAELLVSFLMLIILNDNVDLFVDKYGGTAIMNVLISLLALFLSHLKFVKIIYNKFNNYINTIEEDKVIFISILGVFIYNLCGLIVFYDLNPKIILVLSFCTTVLSFSLVYLFFKTKDDFYKISNNYNNSLLSLKELEKAITNHRIDNHENRNQLMTIRNMTTSKKITAFIDSILDNKIKDDKSIMKETSIIPSGGLRGLIYSKILLMVSKNIEYELDVSNSVRIVDLLDYDDNLMLDVCKIIGIFLDNAIEEVDTIDDKYIVIEMYIDNDDLYISISNPYNSNKDISNIYTPGVSSKGGNHGYGLPLVKKIVKYNNRLETYNEVTDEEFSQTLIIKK